MSVQIAAELKAIPGYVTTSRFSSAEATQRLVDRGALVSGIITVDPGEEVVRRRLLRGGSKRLGRRSVCKAAMKRWYQGRRAFLVDLSVEGRRLMNDTIKTFASTSKFERRADGPRLDGT